MTMHKVTMMIYPVQAGQTVMLNNVPHVGDTVIMYHEEYEVKKVTHDVDSGETRVMIMFPIPNKEGYEIVSNRNKM